MLRLYWITLIWLFVSISHGFVVPTVCFPSRPSSTSPFLLSHLSASNNQQDEETPLHRMLPSTFDLNLPASLRGEAVRSAIRSHSSGVLIDYSSHQMPQCNIGGVVVSGRGTTRFLEGKLTQTFSDFTSSISHSDPLNVVHDNLKVERGSMKQACLLTPKGHIIDTITVLSLASAESPIEINEATLLTSPGHAGSALFDRLDPYIFPFDDVQLIDLKVTHPMYHHLLKDKPTNTFKSRVFTVAASNLDVVVNTIQRLMIPLLLKECGWKSAEDFTLPHEDSNEFIRYTFTNRRTSEHLDSSASEKIQINVIPLTFLPSCICKGYTFIISETNESTNDSFAHLVWNAFVNPISGDGPICLGPLEWDTLRIEAGYPAFGAEMTGDWVGLGENSDHDLDFDRNDPMTNVISNRNDETFSFKKGLTPSPISKSLNTYFSLLANSPFGTRASPLELKLDNLIDTSKGCYQGQEQISAILKNMRGPPRTLYSVSFPDEDNYYNDSSHSEDDDYVHDKHGLENQTVPPKVGDSLYVLGSNEKIFVGKLTSVAERSGSSKPETLALALVRRFDSIISSMISLDLDTSFDENDPALDQENGYNSPIDTDGSGILRPPALDPLGGLEVCIGGSFTMGKLKVMPWRRLSIGQNLFEKEFTSALINNSESSSGVSSVMGFIPQNEPYDKRENVIDKDSFEKKTEDTLSPDDELKRAIEEAEIAAKVAEAALAEAKRKAERIESLKAQAASPKVDQGTQKNSSANPSQQESQRKAEKMEALRRQAEAALERRKKQKIESISDNDKS